MKTRLYRLIFGVRPTPGHPNFKTFTHGLVHIYLFAETLDEANKNATSIIEALPFELVLEKAAVTHSNIQPIDPSPERIESHTTATTSAWEVGLGLTFDFFTWQEPENWFLELFAR